MTALGFGEPWLLAGLVIAVVVAAAVVYGARRRRAVMRALGGPARLRGGHGERLRALTGAVVVLAVVLAVVAAARPQWGEDEQPVSQRGIDLVIALDVSRSMTAEDISPSRAEAAAAGLEEMLSHMTGNRVGLVLFAGDAFPRAPLTIDLPVLTSLVTRAQAEAPLVSPGTDFREALSESFRLLEVEDGAETQAVLLVSDGEDQDSGYQEAVDFAERRGIRIYTVFAATSNPTPLPETSGGTDVSLARPDVLESIAAQTGGSFRTPDRIPGLAVEFRRLQQTQFGEAAQTEPIERYAWFAGSAAALLLLVSLLGEGASPRSPRLRAGTITTLLSVVALLLVGCGTVAWQHVRDGNEAYESERYEEALDEYRRAADAQPEDPAINYNIANALHRLGRFEEAASAGTQARTYAEDAEDGETAALALFTLGNTHFRQSDLGEARDAYQAALRIDPDDQDAKANLELVMGLLEPPEPPAEEPGAGEGEGGEQGGAGPQPGGEGEGNGEDGGSEEPGPEEEPPGGSEGPVDSGSSAGQPDGTNAEGDVTTLEDAQQALEAALGELGPEITLEEALRILELSRRANELNPLPNRPGGGIPPR